MEDTFANSSTDASCWVTDGFTVSIDTGVISRTFLIHSAADLVAALERITRHSIGTGADWFTVDNFTDGGRMTVAGALADTIQTGLIRRTLVVHLTSCQLRWDLSRYGGSTPAVLIQEAIRRALTHHSSQRSAVHDAAELILTARLYSARIHAALVDAHVLTGTFRIGSALGSRWTDCGDLYIGDAAHEGVSSLTRRTVTDGLMHFSRTDGGRSASDRLADLNADAVEPVADLCVVAVVVTLTADRDASGCRVSLSTGGAVALRSVDGDSTEGVGTALVTTDDARIQAFTGDASAI